MMGEPIRLRRCEARVSEVNKETRRDRKYLNGTASSHFYFHFQSIVIIFQADAITAHPREQLPDTNVTDGRSLSKFICKIYLCESIHNIINRLVSFSQLLFLPLLLIHLIPINLVPLQLFICVCSLNMFDEFNPQQKTKEKKCHYS